MTDYARRNRELFEQLHAGDATARNKIVLNNMGWVQTLATRHVQRRPSLDLDDAVQAATIGLMESIDTFDPTRGFAFTTYATTKIKQQLQLLSYGNYAYSADRNTRGTYLAAKRRAEDVAREQGIALTSELISQHANTPLSVDKVDRLRATDRALSLDMRMGDDDDAMTLGEVLTDEDNQLDDLVDSRTNDARLSSLLADITTTQQTVIELRYGIGYDRTHSWHEVATILSITPSDVRRLEHEAMRKLRSHNGTESEPQHPPVDSHAQQGYLATVHTRPEAPAIATDPADDAKHNANYRTMTRTGVQDVKSAYAVPVGEVPAALLGQIVERLVAERGIDYTKLAHDSGVPERRIYSWRQAQAWGTGIATADDVLRALDAHSLWHEQPLASYLQATWQPPALESRKLTAAERAFHGMHPRQKRIPSPDFLLAHEGTIVTLRPQSMVASRWLHDNVDDTAAWHGDALVFEPRYLDQLGAAIDEAGYTLTA